MILFISHQLIDVLIIDDVQFRIRKNWQTQDVFFTYSTIYIKTENKLSLLYKAPVDMQNIEQALTFSFQMGIVSRVAST